MLPPSFISFVCDKQVQLIVHYNEFFIRGYLYSVIGIATIADSTAQCDSILDHIIDFVEENCEAEMTEVIREIR